MQYQESGTPILLAEAGTVSVVSGTLLGFYVNSTGGGTVVIEVGSSGDGSGTAVTGTITPVIGWHGMNIYCPSGCYADIGGTINMTLIFTAG